MSRGDHGGRVEAERVPVVQSATRHDIFGGELQDNADVHHVDAVAEFGDRFPEARSERERQRGGVQKAPGGVDCQKQDHAHCDGTHVSHSHRDEHLNLVGQRINLLRSGHVVGHGDERPEGPQPQRRRAHHRQPTPDQVFFGSFCWLPVCEEKGEKHADDHRSEARMCGKVKASHHRGLDGGLGVEIRVFVDCATVKVNCWAHNACKVYLEPQIVSDPSV
eukprot:CAMPEP_0198228804 /NCGR_PEP_ID=MMETSP1445-20131203/113794_1 /TAXON_ID=36898 /ORGANISM="Pyramimonas sp., Strain CCMP2087" /LENGTH=219 /DNA_ID=CAMNT_0043909235 /DNA_START=717 /DNA_END=1377 /DNA_ORIENTATION=+